LKLADCNEDILRHAAVFHAANEGTSMSASNLLATATELLEEMKISSAAVGSGVLVTQWHLLEMETAMAATQSALDALTARHASGAEQAEALAAATQNAQAAADRPLMLQTGHIATSAVARKEMAGETSGKRAEMAQQLSVQQKEVAALRFKLAAMNAQPLSATASLKDVLSTVIASLANSIQETGDAARRRQHVRHGAFVAITAGDAASKRFGRLHAVVGLFNEMLAKAHVEFGAEANTPCPATTAQEVLNNADWLLSLDVARFFPDGVVNTRNKFAFVTAVFTHFRLEEEIVAAQNEFVAAVVHRMGRLGVIVANAKKMLLSVLQNEVCVCVKRLAATQVPNFLTRCFLCVFSRRAARSFSVALPAQPGMSALLCCLLIVSLPPVSRRLYLPWWRNSCKPPSSMNKASPRLSSPSRACLSLGMTATVNLGPLFSTALYCCFPERANLCWSTSWSVRSWCDRWRTHMPQRWTS
jgi:hypothetical protein